VLGLQAFGARGVLTATQEAREVITELRELFVLRPRNAPVAEGLGRDIGIETSFDSEM
jgi:hypothetical protein